MAATAIGEVVKAATGSTGVDPDYYTDETDLAQYTSTDTALSDKMTVLVKGVGYANTAKAGINEWGTGGNTPLTDPAQIFGRAMRAEKAWKTAIHNGHTRPQDVVKSMSPAFASQFGAFMSATPQSMAMGQFVANLQQQLSGILPKNTTLTAPLATGFVPYNLVAPSRLIYPVYSPFRNKIPRTQGQGTSYRAKVVTGVSGSQTGSNGGAFVDIAIPELVQGGGSMNNWPLNLPASGVQSAVDLNVPYKFLGLSENISWLAQFSGQGFEDVAALANLMLLQEMMLNEEAQIIAATATALTTPSAPTATARTPNAGETAISGTITNDVVDIKVSAANFWGETAASAVTAVTSVATGTSVIDVQISPVPGALWYNIYVTVGTVAGTYHIMEAQVGGLNFTLQGAVPTTGALLPTADTGTATSYRYEGLIPTIAGHSDAAVYPSGWQGGYISQTTGDTLSISVINAMLQGLWNGTGAFRADPAEIVGEGSDIMRLSDDIIQAGSQNNYRLFVEQGQTPGLRAGGAVSEFVNPVTRSIVRIVVHPWWPQGTAVAMTYQLPFSWSNVANAWEMNLVQDYLSIAWPVIDATFRFSMFVYGALCANAPQYSGIITGLQRTNRAGSTGTWS